MSFTKVEYMGGQDPVHISNDMEQSVNTPLWRLSGGFGTFLVDFNTLAVVANPDGTTSEALQHCAGTLEYELIAVIYKDAVVTLQIP